jgi:hypothetical protein
MIRWLFNTPRGLVLFSCAVTVGWISLILLLITWS